MKMYGGVEVYFRIFLTSTLGRGEWSASRPGLIPGGKSSPYPLDRRLNGAQSQSGRGGEGEKNPCPYREPNTALPYRSLVTILAELSRLLY